MTRRQWSQAAEYTPQANAFISWDFGSVLFLHGSASLKSNRATVQKEYTGVGWMCFRVSFWLILSFCKGEADFGSRVRECINLVWKFWEGSDKVLKYQTGLSNGSILNAGENLWSRLLPRKLAVSSQIWCRHREIYLYLVWVVKTTDFSPASSFIFNQISSPYLSWMKCCTLSSSMPYIVPECLIVSFTQQFCKNQVILVFLVGPKKTAVMFCVCVSLFSLLQLTQFCNLTALKHKIVAARFWLLSLKHEQHLRNNTENETWFDVKVLLSRKQKKASFCLGSRINLAANRVQKKKGRSCKYLIFFF